MSSVKIEAVSLAVLAMMISWWGTGLHHPDIILWSGMNVWYDADVPRVFENMTIRERGHSVSFKHPIFSILLWPPTTALTALTGDAVISVRLLVALNAGLAVLILTALTRRMGLGAVDRILVNVLFIASAGFAFWFTTIETFAFGGMTILFSLFAAHLATEGRERTALMVLCGIAGLSMTITNFGVFCIALAVGLRLARPEESLLNLVRRAIPVGAVIVGVTAVIAIVQDLTFGDAGLFFNPMGLYGEKQFALLDESNAVWARPVIILIGSMVYGAATLEQTVNITRRGDFEITKLNYPEFGVAEGFGGLVQLAAMAAFAIILVWSLWLIVREGAPRVLRVAPGDAGVSAVGISAALSAAFFVALHMVYGAEVFLYVAHSAPVLVVVVACALAITPSRIFRGVAALAALLMLLRNYPALVEAHELLARHNFGVG